MKTTIKISLFLIGSLSFTSLVGQEYDDLYFTKKDRAKQSTAATSSSFSGAGTTANEARTTSDIDCCEPSFLSRQMAQNAEIVEGENLAENEESGVSEASINRYKRSSIDQYINEEGEVEENPNFSRPGYAQPKEEAAINEWSEEGEWSEEDQVVINNYYSNVPPARNPRWGG